MMASYAQDHSRESIQDGHQANERKTTITRVCQSMWINLGELIIVNQSKRTDCRQVLHDPIYSTKLSNFQRNFIIHICIHWDIQRWQDNLLSFLLRQRLLHSKNTLPKTVLLPLKGPPPNLLFRDLLPKNLSCLELSTTLLYFKSSLNPSLNILARTNIQTLLKQMTKVHTTIRHQEAARVTEAMTRIPLKADRREYTTDHRTFAIGWIIRCFVRRKRDFVVVVVGVVAWDIAVFLEIGVNQGFAFAEGWIGT